MVNHSETGKVIISWLNLYSSSPVLEGGRDEKTEGRNPMFL